MAMLLFSSMLASHHIERVLAGAGVCLLVASLVGWWSGWGSVELSASLTMPHLASSACVLVLLATFGTTSARHSAVLVAALLGTLLSLSAASKPRPTGDAGEYLAMSLNLARLSP